jgi:hypothetical protein
MPTCRQLLLIALFPTLSPAGVDFNHAIVPLLRKHCAECHTGDKLKGGLSINDRVALLKGGENGPIVDLKHPEKSHLLEVVSTKDEDLRMPPKGPGLSAAEVGLLRQWLAEALDAEPLAVAPGIFYVFKDQDFEQRFLLGRQENRRNVLKFTRQSRPERPLKIGKADAKYQACPMELVTLWETRISLGRMPERGDIGHAETLAQHFNSIPAALRFIQSRKENAEEILEQARSSRLDDLRIYFADFQFRQHSAYRHLEGGLQRDIKAFFGDYRVALEQGRALLFASGRPENIAEACRIAAKQGSRSL